MWGRGGTAHYGMSALQRSGVHLAPAGLLEEIRALQLLRERVFSLHLVNTNIFSARDSIARSRCVGLIVMCL